MASESHPPPLFLPAADDYDGRYIFDSVDCISLNLLTIFSDSINCISEFLLTVFLSFS